MDSTVIAEGAEKRGREREEARMITWLESWPWVLVAGRGEPGSQQEQLEMLPSGPRVLATCRRTVRFFKIVKKWGWVTVVNKQKAASPSFCHALLEEQARRELVKQNGVGGVRARITKLSVEGWV